jgi:hypothetical protein
VQVIETQGEKDWPATSLNKFFGLTGWWFENEERLSGRRALFLAVSSLPVRPHRDSLLLNLNLIVRVERRMESGQSLANLTPAAGDKNPA